MRGTICLVSRLFRFFVQHPSRPEGGCGAHPNTTP
jgi:hypothetical protein